MPRLFQLAILVICCSGCGAAHFGSQAAVRAATFRVSYREATNALAGIKPAVKWRGKWFGVRGTETLAGQEYTVRILEGGSDWHKFRHETVVRVTRLDDSSCQVGIHSWARNMVFPSHRMWFKERRRWHEVEGLLKSS